ncbi:MAG: DUF4159 domain-containing protein [Rhodobacteraceae bacterium]|nr:DUF4159 domain-containing protein [Paracoccaceae bacterium]
MIGFLSPAILLGLLALPLLWWLLRAVPPAPSRRRFPGVQLLLGLKDPESTPDHTPWWLLLLRLTALAAAIIAFAEPVLNPRAKTVSDARLLVLLDGGWASAPDWQARLSKVEAILASSTRPVALRLLTAPLPAEGDLGFAAASDLMPIVQSLTPAPYTPDRAAFADWLVQNPQEPFQTIWLSDGMNDAGPLAKALQKQGALSVVSSPSPALSLLPARIEGEQLLVPVHRVDSVGAISVPLLAIGPAPDGVEQVLWRSDARFTAGETDTLAIFDMPFELRNRITRIALGTGASAGGVVLADSGLIRRKVALYTPRDSQEGPQLVDPLFYLKKALEPSSQVIRGTLDELLLAVPDVLILADVTSLPDDETTRVLDWVEAGGTLLRFAGPRLASASRDIATVDPLLPVQLRAGGRQLGGAMTWATPKRLRPFGNDSPFAGLVPPDDVEVFAQVLAQPGPDLAGKVMAALEDGTPLVTATRHGQGRIVLFHVTANAEWSNLPLSGLFVDMLTRLSVSARGGAAAADELAGQNWLLVRALDGFGNLVDAAPAQAVSGEVLGKGERNATTPPGYYQSNEREVAVNLLSEETLPMALYGLPANVVVEGFDTRPETPLKPLLLLLAFALLALDIMASLFISGRLRGGAQVALVGLMLGIAPQADAQETTDARALLAANNTVLAYVLTGDSRTDEISRAGLYGLSRTLFERTSIEPVDPISVDIERDDISLIPFLYWPVSDLQTTLSPQAAGKVNSYLRNGGMILFDTRDAQLGAGSINGAALQRLTAQLEIPPLSPIEPDHVLGRSFYLLEVFPGRWNKGELWVEAPSNLTTTEGAPFRNLNDGVTPVVIGSNDFASAWALNENGRPMYPVGTGTRGDRQRELAKRFGVNLIMYVMTGNYKSDQVHIPALLERLGQ